MFSWKSICQYVIMVQIFCQRVADASECIFKTLNIFSPYFAPKSYKIQITLHFFFKRYEK